jgi:hypothetical protein
MRYFVSRIKILRYLLLYVILIGWEEGIYVLIWGKNLFFNRLLYTGTPELGGGGGGQKCPLSCKILPDKSHFQWCFLGKIMRCDLECDLIKCVCFHCKSTHYCRFISSPGSIEVPLWCTFAPLCLFIVPASLTVYTSVDHYNSSKCSNKSNSRSQHHSLARRYGCF